MGIENKDDEDLAKLLKIKTRQGYLFGHPENPKKIRVKNDVQKTKK